MARAHWRLALAMWLLATTGCAGKRQPATDPHHYLLLDDSLPLDTLVCAPLEIATDRWQWACAPVESLRWLLRHQTKG